MSAARQVLGETNGAVLHDGEEGPCAKESQLKLPLQYCFHHDLVSCSLLGLSVVADAVPFRTPDG